MSTDVCRVSLLMLLKSCMLNLVRPHLDYASQVWSPAYSSDMVELYNVGRLSSWLGIGFLTKNI